ncbi:MAG: glycosyltransferase [Gammaproteobacteria bacterium]
MPRRILYGVYHWGLGHATRSLVLLRALIARGDQITILMQPGAGMQLLQSELGDTVEYYPFRDTPAPFSRYPAVFYLRMSLSIPWVLAGYRREHRLTERLVKERQFDCVVSDSRIGVWSEAVPSYVIFHSIHQIIPGRIRWMEHLVEWGQRRLLRGYTKVLIPDAEAHGGLSGDLGHYPYFDWGAERLEYIGPLSDVSRPGTPQDLDYFFSVSGIEPQRSLFGHQVLAALPHLQGRIVVTLGDPTRKDEVRQIGAATVYGYLNRARQAETLNRAHVVITRSGYTTLMELAELGKRALFVPTPGQSEQEYLARFHHRLGHVYSTTQKKLDIVRDLPRADAAQGLPQAASRETVQRFLAILDSGSGGRIRGTLGTDAAP